MHCAFEDVLPGHGQFPFIYDPYVFMHQKQNQYVSPFFIGSKLQIFYSKIDHFLGVENDSKKESILL